jgi:cellulose synthase/poly-beta-1,6-N-acetylglucosamine synthase-like glycosyltransferase
MGHHITPTIPFTPSAQTAPCATLHQFFNQSLRWLKGGLLGSPDLYPAILGIGIQNALAFFAITRLLPVLFLWSSMTIIGVLWLFLFFSFRKTGSKENLLFFPVYYIFMLVETMVMIIPLLTFSPEWKQRKM